MNISDLDRREIRKKIIDNAQSEDRWFEFCWTQEVFGY